MGRTIPTGHAPAPGAGAAAGYDRAVAKKPPANGKVAKDGGPPSRGRAAPDERAVPVDPALLRTRQIIERRRRREPDLTITRMVGELGRQAKRDAERSGRVAEAWRAAMPAELVEASWIESSTSVQILVGVESAPAAYAIDRALRSGALATLRRTLQAPGLLVRTRIGRAP